MTALTDILRMAAKRARQENHIVVCASAILGGLLAAVIGFAIVGGALGVTLGGAGIGAGAMGLWGALSGQTPRLF